MKIKINTHGGPMPVVYGECADLFTAEDVTLKKLEYKSISLGVSIELPEGYYAKAYPRSSTCAKHGIMLANSVGIIDNAFSGNDDIWHFPAVAIRDTFIPAGTRICQMQIVKQEQSFEFVSVESLDRPSRGGLGSTGI